MGKTSVAEQLSNLGLDHGDFEEVRKGILHFLKETIANVQMASDEALEGTATRYLHDSVRPPAWVLRLHEPFRWSVETDRTAIQDTIRTIMCIQQRNKIRKLHQAAGYPDLPCPGCRTHEPPTEWEADGRYLMSYREGLRPKPSPVTPRSVKRALTILSEPSDDSDHSNHARPPKHMKTDKFSTEEKSTRIGLSRTRTTSISTDAQRMIDGFSAALSTIKKSKIRDSKVPTTNLHDFSTSFPKLAPAGSMTNPGQISMTLRGKEWLFSSVEEKARILELVVKGQLERTESLLVELKRETNVVQYERQVEDCLLDNGVELAPWF